MRWGFVVLLLQLAACESHYGAYLVIQGDVEFDHVELYFGTPADSSGTGSANGFATPTFGEQTGLVFARTFDASDVATIDLEREATHYLPPTGANQQLGAYVVAVALLGDRPVGIAEYFDFKVPSDEVHQYKLKLEPWGEQLVDRWGAAPGCIAWKRTRPDRDAVVAVVRNDDRDCDALVVQDDCNDLCSGQTSACSNAFCDTVGACALGCARSGLCAQTLCLPPTTCSTVCADSSSTVQDRIDCGTANTPEHLEAFLNTNELDRPCATSITFSPTVACADPMIEATVPSTSGFVFKVSQSPSNVGLCELAITPNTTAVLADTDKIHLLISLASGTIGPRHSLIIGIQPNLNVDGCDSTPNYFLDGITDPIHDCVP